VKNITLLAGLLLPKFNIDDAIALAAKICAKTRDDPDAPVLGGEKRKPKNKPNPKQDPLEIYPVLREFWPTLWGAISESTEGAIRQPDKGSAAEMNNRRALARLGKRYGERKTIKVFVWLFQSSHPQAKFWASVTHAISPLVRPGRDGDVTKWEKILIAYEKAQGKSDLRDLEQLHR